jgi:hypothetical protein
VTHVARCGGFWLWGLAGALVTLTVVGAASIGIFVLPAAVLVLWLAARSSRLWPEALGGLAGAAAICFAIAWIQWEPGGLEATPWLVAGAVLGSLAVGGYALAARRLSPGD